MSVLDTLKAASRARRTITLCVDPALQSDWDRAREALDVAAAQDQQSGSLAFENTARVVEEMEAVRERMAAAEVTFTFEQLDWPQRLALQAEHPPRKENLIDQVRGWNVETFTPALIKASCVSVSGADGDEATEIPDDVWETLLASLNLGQMELLSGAAMAVNDRETAVPTSARSLLANQDSGASLAQPSPGTSPRNGSAAGSRRTSRTSSATKKAASPAS